LIYVPFYLLIKEEKIAEKLAIWAYYAMVLWVFLEIIALVLENKFKKWKKNTY
jgi:hypothetical protein